MTENLTGFTFGGRLKFGNQTYVHRKSDDELLKELTKGNYCYILNARQTGKSSLCNRIVNHLKKCDPKFDSVIIDITGMAIPQINWGQWCYAITEIIAKAESLQIMTPQELDKWWKGFGNDIAPLQRHINFLENYVLKQLERKVVIFIDEADRLFSFSDPKNTDAFFAFIRSCYEKRDQPDACNPCNPYNRLTYCIVGTTSPNNFIRDPQSTPFNIGRAITLEPFKLDEVQPLITMLEKKLEIQESKSKELMKDIIYWTGGQPFLTQKLCHLIVEERQNNSFVTVEEVVNSKVIQNWRYQDEPVHFGTIKNRFLDNEAKAFDRLWLYKEILENGKIEYDNTPEQIELRLSGLVLENQGQLILYNPIYREIFNLSWIEQEKAKLRLYIEEFDNWKEWKKWNQTNNLAYDLQLQERYLLYGTKCDEVQQWRQQFKGDLYEKEGKFLDQSQHFWGEVRNLFSDLRVNERVIESIIQLANDLTGGLSQFNRIIFNIAKNNNVVDLQQDEVQGWLENLVLSNSSNLELFEKYELFCKDRDQFLNQDDIFDLISIFEKISQRESILFDENNPQHRKLKAMCFIILDKERNLRILNKIYEKILDQNWIKGVMAKLRPYTKAFRDWQHSDRQESSYLLQNNNLKLALEWLGKKPILILEEREIEFVMTSLVVEVWTTASPSVQSEAISLITTFRPSLQRKNNYSDFLLREILQLTTSQTSALKNLLEWVNESDIPVNNVRKYLEVLVRLHIKNWSFEKSFDFALAPHSSSPEREKGIFITFDQYCLGEMNQSQIQETLWESGRTLDKYQRLNENDFQELVFNFLKTKIARISLMTQQRPEQERLDSLLDETVTTSKGHLKSILIFNLENGLPLYHNKKLESDDPELYRALFAEGGDAVGEAIEGFESLSKIQEALDNFGKVTAFGNLTYSIFKLARGTMMVYFVELTTPFAICFIAPDGINLGLVVTRSQAKIKDIKKELEDLGF